ncbi:hypothetical protein DLAC_09835 [Tieghemostelium lacteum]|uniref:Uncharacterized protein n=1 Tax=Tieghemostelium lacteum TaxID=361077 RepID=A0A151Z7C1_TIELA|nr:hypothetical protein DLAC_09835 [Tieghemostelium lacteum]|eukprot:KYQ89860.1 hypothetical protein DLAC_09835 [Tieghemostelium lacteum]
MLDKINQKRKLSDYISFIRDVYPNYDYKESSSRGLTLFDYYFKKLDSVRQFVDHFVQWVDKEDTHLEYSLHFCQEVVKNAMSDPLLFQDKIVPWLKAPSTSNTKNINHNNRDILKIRSLIFSFEIDKYLIDYYFRNDFMEKLFLATLHTDQYSAICFLQSIKNISFDKDIKFYFNQFPFSIMQDIFIKDWGTQNYSLNNSKQTSCPLLILKITEKLIKSLYKGKNQFQGDRESVVPMNVGFVRLLMTIASNTEMYSFKEFVCLNTFQNLTKKEIHELKEDYMSFLPYSFEFSNSIGYYKEHFGKEYIEKETLSFFFKNVKIGANLSVLSTIDRNTIKSNLTKIYTSLEGFLKTKHSSISFVPIIHCLSGITAEYGKITSKFAKTIVNAIFKHPKTLFDTNQPLQDLFIMLCSQFPEIVLKEFITIVDCTLCQNPSYGCKVFFTLGLERIRKLEKFEAYSKALWNQLKKSNDAKSAGLLIYFGSDPKEVLKYLKLEQYSLPFGDLSGEKVLLKLIEADDKRYLNILHNQNHLITGKEGQQIAIEWAQTKEDFQSLFKLVVETATNLETSLWCSDFIKYFIGSEYEDLTKQCLSDILLINRSRELFDLMGRMNRYFDIDSSILKYFIYFIHDYQKEVALDLLFSVNNIPNNFLDTQEYFSLNFKTQLEVYHQLYFSPKSSLSTPMDYCNRDLSIIHQKTIYRILPRLSSVSAKELYHVVDLFKDIPIEDTKSELQISIENNFKNALQHFKNNRKKVLKYITKLKNTTISSNLKFLFDGEGDNGHYHSYKEFFNVYQCESLSLSTAPIYKFEKDLVNLKHLYLETSENSIDLFFNSVEEFVKHCTQLQSFTLNVKGCHPDLKNIVKLILEHNSGTLSIVKIFNSHGYYSIDYEYYLKEFKNSHNEFTYEIKQK